jgi:hypothetical protein
MRLNLKENELAAPNGFSVQVDEKCSQSGQMELQSLAAANEQDRIRWLQCINYVGNSELAGIFGGSLSVGMRRSPYAVPAIVYCCIQHLKSNALKEEGLLRVPGSNSNIMALKEAFDSRNCALPDAKLMVDPHSVAGILKLYFRELNDSLIPEAMYAKFIAVGAKSLVDMDKKVMIGSLLMYYINTLEKFRYLNLAMIAYTHVGWDIRFAFIFIESDYFIQNLRLLSSEAFDRTRNAAIQSICFELPDSFFDDTFFQQRIQQNGKQELRYGFCTRIDAMFEQVHRYEKSTSNGR